MNGPGKSGRLEPEEAKRDILGLTNSSTDQELRQAFGPYYDEIMRFQGATTYRQPIMPPPPSDTRARLTPIHNTSVVRDAQGAGLKRTLDANHNENGPAPKRSKGIEVVDLSGSP